MRQFSFGLLAACGTLLGALMVVPSAQAQSSSDCGDAYPPTRCEQLQVSSTSAEPGDRVNVAGDGFAPNSGVAIDLRSHITRLANLTADRNGAFAASVTIPTDTTAGGHRLLAIGRDPSGSGLTLVARITVRSASAGTPVQRQGSAQVDQGSSGRTGGNQGGALPRTGSSWTTPLVATAIGLVACGSVLLLLRRRRASSSSKP